MWKSGLALAVFFLLAMAAPASAQTARIAASQECSRQATEKGLHGKARKKFRSKCLKAMKRKGQ
jgi:hypothetical protein